MKFFKENPFFAGVAAAAVVVLGALGYLVAGAVADYVAQEEEYTSKVAKLHKLQNASPYPSEENLAAKIAAIEGFKAALREVEDGLAQWQGELPQDVTPQGFQDDLRKIVSELEGKAQAAKVGLPDDFYLGLNNYRAGLPTPEATPYLVRQMLTLRWIVEKLIESGVAKVDLLQREALPVENDPQAGAFPPNPEPSQVVRTSALKISFSGETAKVRRAINEIVRCPHFLIIRALSVQNSSLQGPPKAAGARVQHSPGTDLASLFGAASSRDGTAKAEALNIILGRETITVQLHLELVDFAPLNLE